MYKITNKFISIGNGDSAPTERTDFLMTVSSTDITPKEHNQQYVPRIKFTKKPMLFNIGSKFIL
ncbi:hypothetical protein PGH12_17805 [Chryseobacterium wangxinyae]|uniref:hypothetical protein n=1 Tax=Chryseobacterium sp. CY350 TaxID=2997336 RepID=UPI002270E104|nr:hypothetical protein [Chryseobacterium sp. CY350]MCY0977692.1 hypothetical protein [Chryseobacterium sp. CY350]WBZ95299.1 hypothetical protein PGH12_17805 [Chryseobacterium sp. CY350]